MTPFDAEDDQPASSDVVSAWDRFAAEHLLNILCPLFDQWLAAPWPDDLSLCHASLLCWVKEQSGGASWHGFKRKFGPLSGLSTRHLDDLMRRGLLEVGGQGRKRRRRRTLSLRLSAAGNALLNHTEAYQRSCCCGLSDQLSPGEQARLARGLGPLVWFNKEKRPRGTE